MNIALEANNADTVTVPGNEVLPDASSKVAVRIRLPNLLPYAPLYCLTYIGSVAASEVASSKKPASLSVAPPINLHASDPPTFPYIPLSSVPDSENIRSPVRVPPAKDK